MWKALPPIKHIFQAGFISQRGVVVDQTSPTPAPGPISV